MRSRALLVSVLALAACGPARERVDAGDSIDAPSSPAIDVYVPPGVDAALHDPDALAPPGLDAAVSPGTDAHVDPGPDAASMPTALCRIGCATAADCVTAGLALYDASHYRCDAGVCTWTGCTNDDECRAAFARSDYACRDVGGLGQCVDTCATSADCGSGTAAFDADNYDCVGGVCEYAGCRDDAECAATFSSTAYVCRHVTPPDVGVPIPTGDRNCVHGCSSAMDCTTASAAFDADNYVCNGEGACEYVGCLSDAECRASFTADRYVCR
ncbi:MAG: hypothetical protein K1X94_08680 [Sandaracinaceae bacterium]|nr:hypothetical protein [Sandaracinaceae bacterium]